MKLNWKQKAILIASAVLLLGCGSDKTTKDGTKITQQDIENSVKNALQQQVENFWENNIMIRNDTMYFKLDEFENSYSPLSNALIEKVKAYETSGDPEQGLSAQDSLVIAQIVALEQEKHEAQKSRARKKQSQYTPL